MKKHIIPLYIAAATLLSLASCTDEQLPGTALSNTAFTPKGEPVEAYLNLSVGGLTVAVATKAPVDDTEAERTVNDMWVFQYDASVAGDENRKLIITPIYLTIEEQSTLAEVPVTLSNNDNESSLIYVVTNTGDNTWATDATSFNTLESLKAQTIPNPAPIRMKSGDDDDDNTTDEEHLSIPMSGCSEEVMVRNGKIIPVDVQRMFAKLEVYVTLKATETYSDASMTSFAIDKILNACTVATTTDGDGAWVQPENSKFEVTRTFTNPVKNDDDSYGPFTIYVPENLSTDESDAIKLIPYIKVLEKDYNAEILSKPYYTAYPGSWNGDAQIKDEKGWGEDYYICRNCIYVISLTVNLEEEPVTASANCLIATPGQTIAFYPYVRDEEMSPELAAEAEQDNDIKERYTFTSYLNSSYEGDAATDGKKIKGMKIIWQTKDCIGDNSDYNLVWIDKAPSEDDYVDLDDEAKAKAMSDAEYRRKIYVKTQKAGNALIAAYDKENPEDADANILWSWHIWVPETGVDPEGGAIEYYHYEWDATNGINTNNYIPGRLLMNLNLGALKEKSDNRYTHDTNTFGTIYQWGRKDPFPPVKMTLDEGVIANNQPSGGVCPYSDGTFVNTDGVTWHVEIGVYDNKNIQIDLTGNTGGVDTTTGNEVFYTVAPVGKTDGTLNMTDDNTVIRSSVQHPTMFIAAREASGTHSINTDAYYNEGDWLPDNDDFLWGGGHPSTSGELSVYSTSNGDSFDADLEDDYGPNKTIFDPCPYGWRVAPGDLWLGFTQDGKNWWPFNTHTGEDSSAYMYEANIDSEETGETAYKQHGFNMYMQGWKGALGSATSFFPSQGVRLANGKPFGDIACGNYHNATVDKMINGIRRVNILHQHVGHRTDGYYFLFIKVFVDDTFFYEKALGCPLRCVRDTK